MSSKNVKRVIYSSSEEDRELVRVKPIKHKKPKRKVETPPTSEDEEGPGDTLGSEDSEHDTDDEEPTNEDLAFIAEETEVFEGSSNRKKKKEKKKSRKEQQQEIDEESEVDETPKQPAEEKDFAEESDGNKRFRNWFLTLNNYSEDEMYEWYTIGKKCKYACVCKEVGKKEKTPHLHGVFVFSTTRTFTAVKKDFPRANIQRVFKLPESVTYIKKDGDFKEWGSMPITNQQKGEIEKGKWEVALDLAKAGRIDEVDARIQLVHARTLDYIYNKQLDKVTAITDTEEAMEWHYGESGAGKSRYARETYPGCYIKMLNKWWENYENQEVVLIEDVDPTYCEKMGHLFKVWTDRYVFRCEIKSSSKLIRPRKFIITSNYSIEECFKPGDVPAMMRRFDVYKYRVGEEKVQVHKRGDRYTGPTFHGGQN